jgi:predicted acylesterase/phospholipase RssA
MTAIRYDTERWARVRRPLEEAESAIVRRHLQKPDDDAARMVDGLRYALSLARLIAVRNDDGTDVEVSGLLELHARYVRDTVTPRLKGDEPLWDLFRIMPDLVERTRRARASLLEHTELSREALEAEVTTRKLALVLGGGGGAGYVYSGCFDALDRAGVVPDLVVGSSIGSLMGMFRARRRRFDLASMVATAKRLSWTRVFRVLETESRYGLPAALRLYLRAALQGQFEGPGGRELRISDLEIPLYTMASGITVDALKHDLHYYEHLLDPSDSTGTRTGVRNAFKAIGVVREFLSRADALVPVAIGRDPGTEDFDVLDAAGFSAAVPGVIHYDVLRDDQRMRSLLDRMYATYGITRLGDGGLVNNVAAQVAWESIVAGHLGRRNGFVLALDCFWPNPRTPVWFALQQAVRSANVQANRAFADLYVPMPRTLSPMNLVPPIHDTLIALDWGRAAMAPHVDLIADLVRPLPVMS